MGMCFRFVRFFCRIKVISEIKCMNLDWVLFKFVCLVFFFVLSLIMFYLKFDLNCFKILLFEECIYDFDLK